MSDSDITTIRGDETVNHVLKTHPWVDLDISVVCSRYLASGSGDTTVRFWDLTTETPHHTARGIESLL